MAGRLDGKVALITGGASGIGLGTVELFVAEGAQVVAADIQDEKGAMLEKRFPGQVVYAHCDVTSEAEIEAALQKAKTEFGGLDILFNNAGISDRMTSIGEITADGWSWIFDILVRGPALGMKHAVPLMLERGGGSIINTASIAGLQAGFGPIAYSTAKAGVIHMSRVAAAQLSPQKIRVNAICPGLIATSIFGASFGLPREVADQMAARVAENAAAAQPVPKAGLPDDIAQAALYLASDAAAFVSGTHLVVDGGITVGGRHSWDPNMVSPFATILGDLTPPAQS
ncbi:NAD(P)-dependent dehydrogenase (short-subunit alcohol dehydrogenase family) [Phenylobacterium haematophilum]|uniref:D-xylose 1-dehydrogenase n=1 Tax=Phenylobacterium haematophilum TaxID=98513 RepID=A0A840A597_9CAUL|nr:SDR family oxidoreductase [Phenylobacterium haematophilum]MBB3892641.1 NAD(P)-dependent dehydrogenase (short-subunit alcohol dehydrogenase family) [Phenylobacterium haematophilum]